MISCINGGFHAPVNEAIDSERLEGSQCNYFIPPFAPVCSYSYHVTFGANTLQVFTPRRPPEGYSAPLVVANTNYIDDGNWKFLGIAFTGCTIDEVPPLYEFLVPLS